MSGYGKRVTILCGPATVIGEPASTVLCKTSHSRQRGEGLNAGGDHHTLLMIRLRKSGNLPSTVSVHSSRERELKMICRSADFYTISFFTFKDALINSFYGVRRIISAFIARACYHAVHAGAVYVKNAGGVQRDAVTVILLNAAASHCHESGSKLPHSINHRSLKFFFLSALRFPRFLLIAVFLAGAFQPFAFSGEADSLRWHLEGQRRVRDGGIEAVFTLIGADDIKIDELEFFYTMEPARRKKPPKSPEDQPEPPMTAYRKRVPPDTHDVVIYGGRYVQLELWAVAKAGGITYVTQTALNLYGESGIDKTDFEKLDTSPLLPGFDIRRHGFYAAMTGEPVNFSMRSGPAGPVRVYLDGEKIAELLPEADVYDYVLPSGRKLATRSLMNHHELLFIADAFELEDSDGDIRFSCCLPMYRSMRDNQDFPRGLAVLFSAVALSVVAIVLKGKRFKCR